MSSTVTGRLLMGRDLNTFIAPQAAYGAVGAAPAMRPVRRTTGRPVEAVSFVQADEVIELNNGLQNVEEVSEFTWELSAPASKQSIYLMSAALHNDFTNYSLTASTFAALADGFTVPAAAYTALAVGDGFWVSGFANSAINMFYIVGSKAAANKIVTTIAPAATEAVGASVTLISNKCKNGELPTYFIAQEKINTSGAAQYKNYFDGVISSATIEIGETGIVNFTASMMLEKLLAGNTTIAGQTLLPPLTDSPMSSGRGSVAWYVDGISATCDQKSMSITIDNGYTGDDAAGCARQYSRGQLSVTASASVRARLNSDPMQWRTFYTSKTRKQMGVLITHPGTTDQSFIVITQGCITGHSQADGVNDIANHEIELAGELNSTMACTAAIYTNWAVAN
jgi:hypothetical protein